MVRFSQLCRSLGTHLCKSHPYYSASCLYQPFPMHASSYISTDDRAHSRKQIIVDASGKPHPDGPTLAEGKHTSISVHLPPTMDTPGLFGKNGAFCEITILDPENYRVAWETVPSLLAPSWLLHAERWQILTELPEGKTKYETTEVMFGPAAYIVKFVVGSWLKLGFQAFADSLKGRAEAAS